MNSLRFSKIVSYVELMKPELTGLSVLSAICSYFVAWDGVVQAATMFGLLLAPCLSVEGQEH